MMRLAVLKPKGVAAGLAFLLCATFCIGTPGALAVQAEEQSGYYDASGLWISQEDSAESGGQDQALSEEGVLQDSLADAGQLAETEAALTGTYIVADGWSEDSTLSTSEDVIYRQDLYADAAETSTITCSYIDTNYSMMEYEQLRDMLTNNLLYSNVNAQITTSAVYTLARDYLYIVLVDDSAQGYRDIYNYVVGNYRCFCVQVKEYRSEVEQAQALDMQTPQEAGQEMAEGFVWNQ